MKDIVVLYHDNCNDGFGGAWVARKKFGERADYIGITHQDPPPEGLKGKTVYMIDIVYSKEEVGRLLKETDDLILIDHHVSTKSTVESVQNHLYAAEHSGAVLAWHYFFPDEEVPLFLKYIEDGDLWNFRMPRGGDFYAFSLTVPFDFKRWDEFIKEFEDEKKRQQYLDYGKSIREYQGRIIEGLLEEAEEAEFEGYRALVSNASVLHSQLGNAMIKKGYDIGIVWRHIRGGKIRISLRSDKGGGVDVAKIAKKYGGGGHQSAAGFIIDENDSFPWQTKE